MNATPTRRRPAVAGYFYPADPLALRGQVDALTQRTIAPRSAYAVVVPHGSYRHAGSIIGSTLARVVIPRRCLVVGPAHTNSWMPWSLMLEGAYQTPLGTIPVDPICAEALRRRCPFLSPDAWGQRGEHAIEVLLPFLQRLGPAELTVVPIVTSSDDRDEFLHFAEALTQVIRMQEEPVLLIASSDLSHYEPQARAAMQDGQLLEAMTHFETEALIRIVQEDHVRMCGYGAVSCALNAARALGASQASLIAYGTSAEAGGDPYSVIGYAGLVVQ